MKTPSDWPVKRRQEAGAALLRYFFMGRATLVVTIGLGGLLALHASFMLADQNRKLDLQNYLSIVTSELEEAQRNSQFVQLIAPLIQDIRQSVDPKTKRPSPTGRSLYELEPGLAVRVAVLTRTFQPYRWVGGEMDTSVFLEPQGRGFVFGAMSRVRSIYDFVFGGNGPDGMPQKTEVPTLTEERLSPERGILLVNLHALGFDLAELTRLNATFQGAYAPGARLDRIDLGNLIGPRLSKPFDLSHSALPAATFESANLDNTEFRGANLAGADFTAARGHNTDFSYADLDGASFFSTRLSGASFERAIVSNADFRRSNLDNAKLSLIEDYEYVEFSQACLVPGRTEMPRDFDWENYEIPDHCCEDWGGVHDPFTHDSSGRCVVF